MKKHKNFDLTDYNSYKIKAICSEAYFPNSIDDIIEIFKNNINRKKIIIGGGYNIIFSKPYFDELFVILGESFSNIRKVDNQVVIAEAGVNMKVLSEFALTHELTGLEIFYDIPSSLGGAVVMNAGASGEEIKDVIETVTYLDLQDFVIKTIKRDDINFQYRNSFFQKNTDKIILTVSLKLKHKDSYLIKDKMEAIKASRWSKQPKEYPNAGSVFKRPIGHYVGTMIESLGLKGYTVGGAQVSEKHAGFIVNNNNATGQDIIELIEVIKAKVLKKFGVDLEIEQRIL